VNSLEKSFAGQTPAQSGDLSKSEIMDALEAMFVKSMEKGLGGMTEEGVDLGAAVSKYEQFNSISQPLLASVQRFVQERRAAAH